MCVCMCVFPPLCRGIIIVGVKYMHIGWFLSCSSVRRVDGDTLYLEVSADNEPPQ